MPKPAFPIVPPYKPELLLAVRHAVKNILSNGGDVFEYGSGYSTLWFAQFANVVTVEHDDEWYAELLKALGDSGLEAEHHLVEAPDMPRMIDLYGMFDLVLVDCLDSKRVAAVKAAISHVKPGGWLLLDDSHRFIDPPDKTLNDWQKAIVSGMHWRHTEVLKYHQTSMYMRPA